MAYCDATDLKKLLPLTNLISLSNDTTGATKVDQTNIDEAIDQADREIDGYLVIAGHSVPMDPIPPMVANLSAKMTIWNLHLRKYFNSEIWRKTYEDCQNILKRIAEGKMTLGQENEEIVQKGGGSYAACTRIQKFNSATWGTF